MIWVLRMMIPFDTVLSTQGTGLDPGRGLKPLQVNEMHNIQFDQNTTFIEFRKNEHDSDIIEHEERQILRPETTYL